MSGRVGIGLLAVVLMGTAAAQALPATTAAAAAHQPVAASGAADGHTPGWTIRTVAPSGWTADCCTYARAIGVDFVLYQGDWTGEPDRVMVLNVWPRALPSLDAELQADRKHFLARDPAAKVGSFAIRHRTMQCAATVFQGTDHIDDAVVFCDPGKASGIRLSWSMSFADSDPTRAALLDAFMHVVVAARYERAAAPAPKKTEGHAQVTSARPKP
jgi:hypothetical protein